jgi:hypothetical protein
MNRRQRIDESNGRVLKSTGNDTQADQNECIGIFSNPTLFLFSRWAVLFAEDSLTVGTIRNNGGLLTIKSCLAYLLRRLS